MSSLPPSAASNNPQPDSKAAREAEVAALLNEANAALNEGRFDDALEYGRQVGFKWPQSGMGAFLCGFAQLQLGQLENALRSYQEAVRLERHRPDYHFQLARVEMSLGQYDAALKRFQEVLRLEPRMDGAHINIGAIHALRGDQAAALRSFHRSLAQSPNSVPAHTSIAEISLAQGELNDAAKHADAALKALPKYLPALQVRAQVAELRGDDRAAEAAFQNILEVDAGNAPALTRLAMLALRAGRSDEARALATRALASAPDEGFAQAAHAIVHGETPATLPASMVSGIFNQFSAAYDRHMTGPLQFAAPQMAFDALADWFATREQPVAALDLGCGTGLFGVLLRPKVATLRGVDLSVGMLQQATRRGIYDQLDTGDLLTHLQAQADAGADLISVIDVVIYVGALEALFTEMARVLAPGGAAVVTVELPQPDGVVALAPLASPTGTFKLMSSGRYQHAPAYVTDAAAAAGLSVVKRSEGTLRLEASRPQAGMVFVLQGAA